MPARKPPRAVGEALETLAQEYLCRQGLRPVCRNFQCKLGEIDLIMQDSAVLVFVEVRYRRSERFGSAVETVDWRKQRKLLRTAQFYLSLRYGAQSAPCRFDILGLSPHQSGNAYLFDWRRNAFGPSGDLR